MLEFGISELSAGECSWAAGDASSSTETLLAGRVLFSRQCFAFDLHEVDHVARRAAEQTKQSQPPDEDEAIRAKDFARKHSLEVPFEDIESIDSAGEVFTLTLERAPSCFFKSPGAGHALATEDVTGGARSIRYRVAAAAEGQVTFAEAKELALRHAPRLEELFRELPAGAEPSPVTPQQGAKRAERPAPGSSVKRRRTLGDSAGFAALGAVWLTA